DSVIGQRSVLRMDKRPTNIRRRVGRTSRPAHMVRRGCLLATGLIGGDDGEFSGEGSSSKVEPTCETIACYFSRSRCDHVPYPSGPCRHNIIVYQLCGQGSRPEAVQ